MSADQRSLTWIDPVTPLLFACTEGLRRAHSDRQSAHDYWRPGGWTDSRNAPDVTKHAERNQTEAQVFRPRQEGMMADMLIQQRNVVAVWISRWSHALFLFSETQRPELMMIKGKHSSDLQLKSDYKQ